MLLSFLLFPFAIFWAFTEAGGRKKPSTCTIALPSSRSSIQRHWKQFQKVPISHKLQFNGNYVSLIYSSAKVYGNIELHWARCKRILKVRYNLSRLLNLRHPVGKSKYGACAVTGLWSFKGNFSSSGFSLAQWDVNVTWCGSNVWNFRSWIATITKWKLLHIIILASSSNVCHTRWF